MNSTLRVLLLGVGTLVVVAGCSSGATEDNSVRDDSGSVVEGGEVGALRLRVGDCFGGDVSGLVETEISSVDAVPCDQPHLYEVYEAFDLPYGGDADYPGLTAIQSEAEDGCYQRFEPFVGLDYESSIYGMTSMHPLEDGWDLLDDREVLCLIGNYDGTLMAGSAAGTGV